MRLDGAIFAIEQRSIGGCIDLAIVFLREHFFSILQLLAWFAVPSVLLTWWLVDRYEWSLAGCLLLFAFECPFFGGALVAAAGHRVFGDRFSSMNGLRHLFRRLTLYSVLIIVMRMIILCALWLLIIPGYMVATRYGFLAEVLLLEGCPARRFESRLTDLMNETFLRLVGRLITVASFFSIVVVSVFVLVDVVSGTLLGLPILIGRVSDPDYFIEELTTLLSSDSRVAVVLVSVAWLVYPVTRLAWMFCYLDVRIRKEAWDVELAFRVEAQRLEEAA
jgi:hypothetical protein